MSRHSTCCTECVCDVETMDVPYSHEYAGVQLAIECLDFILNSETEEESYRSLLELLDGISGDSMIAKASRRGASGILYFVVERGLSAIRGDSQ